MEDEVEPNYSLEDDFEPYEATAPPLSAENEVVLPPREQFGANAYDIYGEETDSEEFLHIEELARYEELE